MPEITAQLVKELRDRTGAGMMECKSALKEANGDLAEAEVVLRKKGIASASKKSARTTKQGKIEAFVSPDAALGVLIEVNCESDFVARTEDFNELCRDLAAHVAAANPSVVRSEDGAGEALMSQKFSKDPALTIEDVVKARIAKLGENMSIARFARFTASGGRVESYIHSGAQLGVLVELTTTKAEASGSAELSELAKDVAMQIAATDPQAIGRTDVPAHLIEKEKEIQKDRARQEGKPEKILDKIIEGRMGKFYEEVCLLEQPFIKENSLKVEELIKSKAGAVGTVTVTRFVRFKVGDTQAAEAAAE
jgi:elongation factor Ts